MRRKHTRTARAKLKRHLNSQVSDGRDTRFSRRLRRSARSKTQCTAGRAEEAREWRRKAEEAQRAFAAQSGGQWSEDGAQIAQQVHQWDNVIAAVVAACKGNAESAQAARELEPVLQDVEAKGWGNLVAVIRRILKGERGAALAAGLDKVDAAVVGKILEGV